MERVKDCVLCTVVGPAHDGEHSDAFFITAKGIMRVDYREGRVREVKPPTEDDR